jgi:hypothetical protein
MESHKIKQPQIQANPDQEFEAALHVRHTDIFRERFPHNVEQIMRLISERMLGRLRNKAGDDDEDVCNLAIALKGGYDIHRDINAR